MACAVRAMIGSRRPVPASRRRMRRPPPARPSPASARPSGRRVEDSPPAAAAPSPAVAGHRDRVPRLLQHADRQLLVDRVVLGKQQAQRASPRCGRGDGRTLRGTAPPPRPAAWRGSRPGEFGRAHRLDRTVGDLPAAQRCPCPARRRQEHDSASGRAGRAAAGRARRQAAVPAGEASRRSTGHGSPARPPRSARRAASGQPTPTPACIRHCASISARISRWWRWHPPPAPAARHAPPGGAAGPGRIRAEDER